MNYQLLGNAVPQLHWHIVPRYWGDPAPGRPLDAGGGGQRFLRPAEYSEIIAELQTALQSKVNNKDSGCSHYEQPDVVWLGFGNWIRRQPVRFPPYS